MVNKQLTRCKILTSFWWRIEEAALSYPRSRLDFADLQLWFCSWCRWSAESPVSLLSWTQRQRSKRVGICQSSHKLKFLLNLFICIHTIASKLENNLVYEVPTGFKYQTFQIQGLDLEHLAGANTLTRVILSQTWIFIRTFPNRFLRRNQSSKSFVSEGWAPEEKVPWKSKYKEDFSLEIKCENLELVISAWATRGTFLIVSDFWWGLKEMLENHHKNKTK